MNVLLRFHFPCLLLALLMALVPVTSSLAAEPVAKTKKVLFIGIDGCRFDAVQAANAPNLD
ncbi:MAG TPA: hypothetical protein VGJ16_14040, partial [Pirellulales bacterium]